MVSPPGTPAWELFHFSRIQHWLQGRGGFAAFCMVLGKEMSTPL